MPDKYFLRVLKLKTTIRFAFFLTLLLLVGLSLFAQNGENNKPLKAKGDFLNDTIEVGLSIYYALSIRHPSDSQLIFPDSSYNFAPFTFVKKEYFTTQSSQGLSLDSVVYELTTFEIDTIQKLAVPILLVEGDSLRPIFPAADSVILRSLVKENLNKAQWKATTPFQSIPNAWNYPYWILIFVMLIVLIGLVRVFLGRQILKTYRMFQFRTRHAIFLQEYTRLASRITSRKSIQDIEKAIVLWKKHLEQIAEKPFSSYTSKEISQILPQNNLAESLKSIDRAIYGQEISDKINDALNVLKSIAIESFEKKKEEMRNA
jgi:hypothetical protein